MDSFVNNIGSQLGSFLPNLIGAIAILILGWLAATVIAAVVKGVLKRVSIDNRLANWMTGRSAGEASPPVEQWIATAVYWIVLLFTIVAFLNALQLEGVSEPLNNFLQTIFSYLPRLGGAAVLLAIAWLLATVVKLVVTRGLSRFNLDERLSETAGTPTGTTAGTTAGTTSSPFLLNETLGNVLYWFVFLFFLPLILDALELRGPLEPVQNLLDQILSALPRVLTAIIIGAIGWLIARIVRGIVTNLLAASGADRIGTQIGLTQVRGGLSLSSLIGTIVYVLVLIPTAIAALQALEIDAISDPAIAMLNQILQAIPKIFTAALILILFYVIGRFVADLVARILTGFGFDNVFNWLGLPSNLSAASTPPVTSPVTPPAAFPPLEPPIDGTQTVLQPDVPTLPRRTPSEIVGILVLVGIMLLATVAATEVLQFEQLTAIVNGVLAISAQVLVGIIIFGVGLYLANLAFNLISSSGGRQARILAQAARIAVIVLISAMALQQMGIATNIVNLAFGLIFGAIAVAIAIAFGLGGRDVASEQLREWLASFKRQ